MKLSARERKGIVAAIIVVLLTAGIQYVALPLWNRQATGSEDLLRAQKHYLDSIDYYRAAIKKSNTAVLHNKVGISLMLMKYATW